MKSTAGLKILAMIVLMLTIGCSTSNEKRIPGEWRVSEVDVEADTSLFDEARLNSLKAMERSVFFVFEEDYGMLAVTGNTTISGTWSFNDETGEISVAFEGNGSSIPSLFGKLEDGKIIKSHESGGLKVTTVYVKK